LHAVAAKAIRTVSPRRDPEHRGQRLDHVLPRRQTTTVAGGLAVGQDPDVAGCEAAAAQHLG
jgi:hypothetical protein